MADAVSQVVDPVESVKGVGWGDDRAMVCVGVWLPSEWEKFTWFELTVKVPEVVEPMVSVTGSEFGLPATETNTAPL